MKPSSLEMLSTTYDKCTNRYSVLNSLAVCHCVSLCLFSTLCFVQTPALRQNSTLICEAGRGARFMISGENLRGTRSPLMCHIAKRDATYYIMLPSEEETFSDLPLIQSFNQLLKIEFGRGNRSDLCAWLDVDVRLKWKEVLQAKVSVLRSPRFWAAKIAQSL
jgi:hypothetical protein